MSTSDVPPPELKGHLGNVTGATAVAPLLAPAPVPNAVQTTPGVTPMSPTSGLGPQAAGPAPDNLALLAQIQSMANEIFGVSIVPMPMAPLHAATAGATTNPPTSPGIAAVMPETTSGPSYTPGASATPYTSAKPEASPFGTGNAYPNAAPAAGTAVPQTPTTSGGAGMPNAGTVPHATGGASPAARSTSDEITTGGNPFAVAPSFDAITAMHPGGMPGLDLVGGAGDGWRAPVVTAPPMDAPPSWMPNDGMLGLESTRSDVGRDDIREPRIEAHDVSTPRVRDTGRNAFDPYLVRKDFPILNERPHGKRLVWLDNAATTQKPNAVIDRLTYYYQHENSNIHRAAHTLAARATDAYEKGRESVRRFLNAPSAEEVIFVRGATEGINLIAQSWGRRNVGAGDEIVLTHLEHHANIVPWQQLCAEKGAKLRIAPVDDRGDVIVEEYEKLLNPRTRLVSFTQVSNALGTITPAKEMIEIARRRGITTMLDGAQAVSHMPVDVQDLGCDFYAFSGHKVFAPTGIGAVWGRREILAAMPPWQGGGNMIQDVTFEKTTYQAPPWRFEAGTGNIADAVGLGEALDYVMRIGMDTIDRYEHQLLVYATEKLATVPGLTMIGTAVHKAGVLSFVLDGQRTEDVGAMLDKEGIAVRSGHHCAQPILRRFGLEASVRASLAFYNICEDIDALVDALHRIQSGRSGLR
jgi:cysteine desulfurase / selenocysteine lyase